MPEERPSTQREKRDLIRWLLPAMARAGGRRYEDIRLDLLDVASLRGLRRLLMDVEAERGRARRW